MPLPLTTVLISSAFLLAAFHGSKAVAAFLVALAFANEFARFVLSVRRAPAEQPDDGTYTLPVRQRTPIGPPEDEDAETE